MKYQTIFGLKSRGFRWSINSVIAPFTEGCPLVYAPFSVRNPKQLVPVYSICDSTVCNYPGHLNYQESVVGVCGTATGKGRVGYQNPV
jgi:hypothetical protein